MSVITVPGHDSFALCGALSDSEVESLLETGQYKSWLVLNPETKHAGLREMVTASAGPGAFNCIEVLPDALTVELGDSVATAVTAAQKPMLIMCNTANRAGAAMLLALAKERGYNFASAMELAVNLKLKFADGFSPAKAAGDADSTSWNKIVLWVQAVLASPQFPSPIGTAVHQLFDDIGGSSTYTYLLVDHETKEAALIDPVLEQVDRDLALVAKLGVHLKYCLNTHVHADHVTGSGLIKQRMNGPATAGCEGTPSSVSSVLSVRNATAKADMFVTESDVLLLGSHKIEAIETPGHTEGCACYLFDKQVLFSGDALLIRGCGRTDFQNGCAEQLFGSVTEKLFALPDSTVVAPGHDYRGRNLSCIGDEKLFNPRLTLDKAGFVSLMDNLGLAYPKKIDLAVPANMQCGVYEIPQ